MRNREQHRRIIRIHASCLASCNLIQLSHTTFEVIVHITFISTFLLTYANQGVAAFFFGKKFTATFVQNEIYAACGEFSFCDADGIGTIAYLVNPFDGFTCLVVFQQGFRIKQVRVGSAQIRGNNELQNGYNYNFDLRYEHFGKNGDMISLTAYFKYLDSPIERIQALQGGATLHSFQNADNGMAGGMEVEFRKQLMKDLRLGANISYMYTNVKLPEGGAYTNKERPLQGASPILANADLTYSPRFGEERQLNLALLYNLQGSRIHAVGVSKLGDIKQQTLHTLNFSAGYDINSHFSLKLQVNDLLNRAVIFKQEVPSTGEEVEVERYKKGANLEIGFSYKL